MAGFTMNTGNFSIGEYHLGYLGNEFYVWNEKFIKYLGTNDFDKAKGLAYEAIIKHCEEIKVPPPPPPL